MLILLLLLFARENLCSKFVSSKDADPNLQVKTSSGLIQGHMGSSAVNGYPYFAYVGIPYARPPVGRLRFMRPMPVRSWDGILNATVEGPHCVQVYYSRHIEFLTTDGTEDCLYLNVFTPQNPQNIREKLPVLVYVHGGAFLGDGSNITRYGPDHFMEQNIILVSLNYRTGIFGFLSTGDLTLPGNYGLKDQVAALKWVQVNIKKFGGDSTRVTLYGESAGAASVIYQMQSPVSKGYFHRAIASSGSSLCSWALQRNPRAILREITEALGIRLDNSTEFIRQLQNVDVKTLGQMTMTLALLHIASDFTHGLAFSPIIEPEHKHAFITQSSYETLEMGNFSRVPLMIGLNSMEASLYAKFINLLQPLMIIYDISPRLFPQEEINIDRHGAAKRIMKHYYKEQSMTSATIEELMIAVGDELYTRPVHKTAELISKYVPVYFYMLSVMTDLGMKGLDGVVNDRNVSIGVAHGEDLWYLWKKEENLPITDLEHITSQRMLRLWSNFVKRGNPTPTSEPLLQNIRWPPMAPNYFPYLEIDKTLSLKENYNEENLKFWEELYKNHSTGQYLTY